MMLMAREARRHRLGPLHPSFDLLRLVKHALLGRLPEDAHARASGRLCVSLTRASDGRNVLVSDFHSREELIEVPEAFAPPIALICQLGLMSDDDPADGFPPQERGCVCVCVRGCNGTLIFQGGASGCCNTVIYRRYLRTLI